MASTRASLPLAVIQAKGLDAGDGVLRNAIAASVISLIGCGPSAGKAGRGKSERE
jgi:hypothetical protein